MRACVHATTATQQHICRAAAAISSVEFVRSIHFVSRVWVVCQQPPTSHYLKSPDISDVSASSEKTLQHRNLAGTGQSSRITWLWSLRASFSVPRCWRRCNIFTIRHVPSTACLRREQQVARVAQQYIYTMHPGNCCTKATARRPDARQELSVHHISPSASAAQPVRQPTQCTRPLLGDPTIVRSGRRAPPPHFPPRLRRCGGFCALSATANPARRPLGLVCPLEPVTERMSAAGPACVEGISARWQW